MKQYPIIPRNAFQLLGSCLANYWPVLKNTWQIALTISLLYFVINSVMKLNVWVGGILVIPAVLFLIFLNGLFWVEAHGALQGQHVKFVEAIAKVKPRYFPMLGTILLLILIMGSFALVIFGIGYLLVTVFHISTTILLPLAIMAFMLWVVLFVYLYFPMLLVLLDNNPVFNSFKASYHLVQRHWWHTFSSLFLAFFLVSLINLTITALISFMVFGDATLLNYPEQNATPLSGTLLIVDNIIQILLSTIFYPVIFMVVLLVFNDLKLRKKPNINLL